MNSPTSAVPFNLSILLEWGWWAFLAAAGVGLVALTLWAYWGHREASRGRLAVLVVLRLLALVIALFTACRPSWKVEEKPNVPSRLLIGIDMSRSMTVPDEAGGQSRIQFVRKILETCRPTLDDLERQNCEVVFYAFGPSEFVAASGKYDPNAEPVFERSDYATYLRRVLQEWPTEKYIRGHIVIGDGADNGRGKVDGKPLTPTDAAGEWKAKAPVQTFAVGDQGTNQTAKDVAFADAVLDPDPVAIKNKFVVRARVNAFKMSGIKVPFKVYFDTGKGYEEKQTTEVTLTKETNNLLEIPVDAPPELPKNEKGEERRQIKVKVEIPVANCPGDTNANNNAVETYLALNKEGVRVLLVDRYRYEYALLIDALAADKRIDVRKVDLQTDQGVEDLKPAFDFDKQAYDVLILGNVSPKQLTAIDPNLPAKIAERVQTKGMGFMMLGGHATLNGSRGEWGVERGWRDNEAIKSILPVELPEPPAEQDTDRTRYMVVPEPRHADSYLTKVADTRENSLLLWERLNTPANKSRFTGLNRVVPKQLAQGNVYLWAKSGEQLVADPNNLTAADRQYPLLVSQQFETGAKSRVLMFAAQDTYLWQRLGQPKMQDGKQLHSRFWRQLVLWLAKQDQEESNAFVRPEFPRLRVNDTEGLKLGIRGPNGAAVTDPKYTLTVTGPGLPEAGAVVPVGVAADGSPRAEFVPRADGEYTATLTASGKTDNGEVSGTATAKFLALPDTSEEMQRTTPDYDLLRSMAAAGGGTFHRIEDLPGFLTELKNQEYITVKPVKKNLPDWRPVASNPFLPFWMVVFALTLVAEWGLRRWWGLV